MIDELQIFGLTEREAKVYYAALSLSKASVDQLAREAGIIRTTTYTQLETLMTKGLMSTIQEGKKTYYIAESPENLSRLLAKQRKQLDQNETFLKTMLPDLVSLHGENSTKPVVRFLPGKEGVLSAREEVLSMKGKTLRAANLYDVFEQFYDAKHRSSFRERRIKKKITMRALYTKSGEDLIPYEYQELKRLSEAESPFKFDFYIFDNKVAFINMLGEAWAVVIEGDAVASSMKVLFEAAWGKN